MSLEQYGDLLATTDPGHVIAWPTRRTLRQRIADWRNRRQTGTTGRHRAGHVQPVDAGHRLSPAAQQLVTRTAEQVPAGPDEDTGFWAPRDITTTNQWTQPVGIASDDEIQQWADGGADIDDQTREASA